MFEFDDQVLTIVSAVAIPAPVGGVLGRRGLSPTKNTPNPLLRPSWRSELESACCAAAVRG